MAEAAITPDYPLIYSIKRHGASITNCDAEPVHTPGCIQDRGVLAALRVADLSVLQISENCESWLGVSVSNVLGESIVKVVGDTAAQSIRHALEHEPVRHNPTYLFTVPQRGRLAALDVLLHVNGDVALLEFEPLADPPGIDAYDVVRRIARSLQETLSLHGFCQRAAAQMRELTGLDRVMIYRFHKDAHGEIFAEARRDDLASWQGMHYPAGDIPPQARSIFSKLWIRPIPDVQLPVVEMVPLANPDTGRPLDMTYCALRGVSTLHQEYLTNMKVAATMTLPILRDGELWGLIACHHYTPFDMPFRLRAACEVLAQIVSLQIKAAEDRDQADYRERIEQVHHAAVLRAVDEGGLARLIDSAPDLLAGIDAGGIALLSDGVWLRAGETPSVPQLHQLHDWLRREMPSNDRAHPGLIRELHVTDQLSAEYPPAAAFADVASGIMAATLTTSGSQMLIWFRPETRRTVKWGGNPDEKPTVIGPHGPRLTPRGSFELFEQSVSLRSLPWLPLEVEAASRLRAMLIDVVVGHSEMLAAVNQELLRSNDAVDAFAYVASHDLKEPLRGIANYAQLVVDEAAALEPEDRERLERIRRLSMRMEGLLNSLLHLAAVGRVPLELGPVALGPVLDEALEMIGVRTDDPSIQFVVPRPLPEMNCDAVQLRQVFSNLISNALKYNERTPRRVEVGYIDPAEAAERSDFPPGTADQRVLYISDNGIGIESRYYEQIFRLFKRLHGRDQFGGGTGAGLAVVRRVIDRHAGRIWLRSTPGVGTTFFFTLGPGE